MKTNILFFTACFCLLAACQSTVKDNSASNFNKEDPSKGEQPFEYRPRSVTANTAVFNFADLNGYWVGDFEPDTNGYYLEHGPEEKYDALVNRINISIDSIEGEKVLGHSVVAGNFRPFTGTVKKVSGYYVFELKEPGDDKYDGKFSFSIREGSKEMKGKWNAYKDIKTPKRKFVVQKTFFKYDPNALFEYGYTDFNKYKTDKYTDEEEGDYEIESYFTTTGAIFDHNSSTEKFTKEIAENLTKADIYILRNAIYAKHGYSFRNRKLREYFDAQPWYIPLHTDIRRDLTDIEKDNIKLLLRYEKNAEEFYDEFGR